jgi:small subunit ribosomal protein S10e
VKKDIYAEKHSDELPMPNLEVMKLLQSFKSKGLVAETYNWRWFYYYLTETGIAYLRQYLGLPDDIVPATLKITASTQPTRPPRQGNEGGDKMKGTGPGGDFNPKFQGDSGYGRGRESGRDSYRRAGGYGRGEN